MKAIKQPEASAAMPTPAAQPDTTRQPRRWLWLLPLLLFIGLGILLYRQLGVDPTVVNQATLGKPLPAFRLPDLQTGQLRTLADLPRQPFLLNVWGSWCPTCKVEHPQLLEMARQQIPIVGVNYKDDDTEALTYLQQYQDPFVLNIADNDGRFGIELGLTGAPETFVVDSERRIRLHITGEITPAVHQQQLLPCLQALQQGQATAACQL